MLGEFQQREGTAKTRSKKAAWHAGGVSTNLKASRIEKRGRAKTSVRFVDQFGKEAVVFLGVVGELLDALFFQLVDGVRDKGVQFCASPKCLHVSARDALRNEPHAYIKQQRKRTGRVALRQVGLERFLANLELARALLDHDERRRFGPLLLWLLLLRLSRLLPTGSSGLVRFGLLCGWGRG